MKENPKTLDNTGLAPTSPPIVSASPKESGTTYPVVPDANVDLKLYKSLQGHQKIMSWYEQLKNEIEVDHESLFVETRFGQTHAIVAGDKKAKPVLLIPGVAGCAPLWRHQLSLIHI